MGIDHGCFGTVMAQKLLYIPNISTVLQQMGSMAMSQGMQRNALFYIGID